MTRTWLAIGFFGLALGLGSGARGDEAQVARGQQLYGKYCSTCHGDSGQGLKKAPPLVGKDALPLDPRPGAKLRKTQFHTAKDVADFAVKNMPGKKPGSLKADEYWAILAFDLKANGVETKEVVGPDSAAKIVLHP